MDEEQFKALIDAMNQNQQLLIERLLSKDKPELTVSKETPVITISHIPPFESYEPKKEKFKYYMQRFENYLMMKDVFQDKDKCAQILLNSIDASNYILAALIAPKAPNELPYDDLLKVLENHLAPKRSCLVSQYYFLSTYQKQDSSISDYVADLRRDIAECEFTVACECSIFLRAQFIRGIKDCWIKEQILQSELTDFNEIVDKAIALETSKIDCRELSKSNTTGLEDINKITKRNRESKNVKMSLRNQTTNQKDLASNYRRKTKKPFLDFEKLGINNLCLHCGNNSHLSRECRSNSNHLKRRACKSTGHVQKVCIKTLLNANISNSPKLATNHVKMYQDIGVNAIVDIYNNRTSESAADAMKYFISVKIENRYQKFEVDTGACYTLIPDIDATSSPAFGIVRSLCAVWMAAHRKRDHPTPQRSTQGPAPDNHTPSNFIIDKPKYYNAIIKTSRDMWWPAQCPQLGVVNAQSYKDMYVSNIPCGVKWEEGASTPEMDVYTISRSFELSPPTSSFWNGGEEAEVGVEW
ncbi:hypothetical protein AVEN_119820-1 [Araneus ventricosus]|uniref:CCHC-type domain-containing protein n=1 Tax=Araneus ventricosus TaxID=182803 RepID=A0A4Y2MR00_ARAVE|nr:hypothetical protein AVEN_119820-1 [Araneus ventricosus]